MGYMFGTGLASQIIASTSKILIEKEGKGGTGSGFMHRFSVGQDKKIPTIITNKHVLKDASKVTIFIPIGDLDREYNLPTIRGHVQATIHDPQRYIVYHNEDDLAGLLIKPVIYQLQKNGHNPIIYWIDDPSIPDQKRLEDFDSIVDVLVVGYPKGVHDIVNNIPVFRKGITATPPLIPYNGERIFLIDVPIFPGSSGSPVFLYYPWNYREIGGDKDTGKLLLIGVVSGTMHYNDAGRIVIVNPEEQISEGVLEINRFLDLGAAVPSTGIPGLHDQVVQLDDEINNSREGYIIDITNPNIGHRQIVGEESGSNES